MRANVLLCAVLALAVPLSVVQALPIAVPDFATDPSGPQFTISAISPTAPWGRSSNISAAPSLTYGVTDPESGTTNTMQMHWEPTDADLPAQAGWVLEFGLDPDVRNQVFTLSINPPGVVNPQNFPAIDHVEIEIIDNNGLSAGGWGFNTDQMGWLTLGNDPAAAGKSPVAGVPPVPPVLPPPPWASLQNNVMQTVTINIGLAPAAGSAIVQAGAQQRTGPNYLIAGNGGSLANAAKLAFYENGNLAGTQAIPANGPNGINNYWDHVSLTPEPTTLVLLALGAMGVCRRRRVS